MDSEPLRRRLAFWYERVIVVIASAFLAQLYTIEIPSYIDLRKYALGQERMPFQARELMRYPLLWAGNSAKLQHMTNGRAGMNSPERLVMMLVCFAAILLSAWAALKIDRRFWPKARVRLLPFAVLVVVFLFDFYLSVPFGFPYDLPAMMFLGWGLYLVLTERFLWLLPLLAIATWNRETSLFLILARAAVALGREGRWNLRSVRRRDVLELTALSVVWAAITAYLHYKYAANVTEAGPRVMSNLRKLANPVLWPAILSGSAFLMPWIYWRRDRIGQGGLQACVRLLPFWVLMLLCVGQILEVRIYGDISVFIAVCAAAILRAEMTGPASDNRTALEEGSAAA
ncbi:MAG TPA: hypothetical protein VM865_08975 [Acidobacteriaceae bacterium]|jgi:hypothetical protein|nr:hypothetical protein [Acidobacteriaceae bacterium]